VATPGYPSAIYRARGDVGPEPGYPPPVPANFFCETKGRSQFFFTTVLGSLCGRPEAVGVPRKLEAPKPDFRVSGANPCFGSARKSSAVLADARKRRTLQIPRPDAKRPSGAHRRLPRARSRLPTLPTTASATIATAPAEAAACRSVPVGRGPVRCGPTWRVETPCRP
jgi:hypothetical protein